MAVELDAGDTMTDRERVARVILDQISQFIALLDTGGRVLEINRAAIERGGLDRENVLGRPFLELGWWGSGHNADTWLATAIGRAAAGEPVHGSVKTVIAGQSIEIEFSLTPVHDDAGRVEYVFVEGRNSTPAEHDIDELKQAQEALRGQARWLETVLESVSDGLIATGADGHIRLMNSAAQTLTGWRMGEAVDRPLEEVFRIVDETTRWPLECPGVTVLREGRVVELANHAVLLARDGTERPITDGGAPIRDEDGSILGGVLCFHDVSLRRQGELAVARLAAIVESSEDAIIGEDLDGHIISWNEGAHRIYGWCPPTGSKSLRFSRRR
jgi:PAS domain S-box-containing protein